MTTQPTLPTFTARDTRVYRFDPDMAPVVSEVPYADHLGICKLALTMISQAHLELNTVERKAEILGRRLQDPEIAVKHGEDDPRREAAWDRLKEYRRQIEIGNRLINQSIADIDSHGRHMASADLVWLGNHTSWDVIERVHAVEPETKSMVVWREIATNSCPF